MEMGVTVSVDPTGAVPAGGQVRILLEWNPKADVPKYLGRITLPPSLGLPDPDPQTWTAGSSEVTKTPDGLSRGQFIFVVDIPQVGAGAHPFVASIEPISDMGPKGPPIEAKGTIAIAEWLTEQFVREMKSNIDGKADNLSTGIGRAEEAIRSVATQLQSVNATGIRLQPASIAPQNEESARRDELWRGIRQSASSLSFRSYMDYMNQNFGAASARPGNMRMPFSQVDAYLRLKAYTELFLLTNVGVLPAARNPFNLTAANANAVPDQVGQPNFSVPAGTVYDELVRARPYLQAVLTVGSNQELLAWSRLNDVRYRLHYPVLLELIWSYWHEESLMVQTLHKIKMRFQNRTDGSDRHSLAQFEMDPLRPLNNILWGYIQDEQHRLGVKQRAYEYLHSYGIGLEGRAMGRLRPADSRARFLQTFHNLLYQCVQFYRQADDATIVANASPLLYALRDLQFILAEGAHNQFGDLPWNARLEMLMEQWILARPEIQEFLRGRRMLPYPEGWMGSVDAMKNVQGWGGTSVTHFRDLGVSGEQILLSIREGGTPGNGAWGVVAQAAAAWAQFWRPEIENYIHAYRAVTGIDLAIDPADPRFLAERDTAPSVHLRRRMAQEAAR